MSNPLIPFEGICKRDRNADKMFVESEDGEKYFISDMEVETNKLQVDDTINTMIFRYCPKYLDWDGKSELGCLTVTGRALDGMTIPYATVKKSESKKPKRKSKPNE